MHDDPDYVSNRRIYPSMALSVTILICTRNRAEYLRKTLVSVGKLYIPDGFDPELVLVDNGSTDNTLEVIRSLELPNMPVRVLQEMAPGAGSARNMGLRNAQGKVVLITDDDTQLPVNWVEAMCRPILDGEADAVAGKIVIAPHLRRDWMSAHHEAILSATVSMDPEAPQDIFGASMAFHRDVLAAVPGFDPELGPGTAVGHMDDTLFSWQLKRAGYRIAYVSKAPVVHHFNQDRLLRSSFISAARRHGRARAYMAYHWQHVPYAKSRRFGSRWLNLLLRYTLLLVRRTIYPKEWIRKEGISSWEFGLIRQISGIKQFIGDSRRPRNYDRHGLRKINGIPIQKFSCTSSGEIRKQVYKDPRSS